MDQPSVNPYAPPAAHVTTSDGPQSALRPLYRPLTTLATVVTVVFALEILVKLGVAANALATISWMERAVAGNVVQDEPLENVEMRDDQLRIGELVLGLAAIVVFCVLVARACRNALSFGQMPMQLTPGWAVGVFFIPILWFWKPYQAMKEIWRASAPDTKDAHELAQGIVPLFFPAWWAAYLARWFLGQTGPRLHTDFHRPPQAISASYMDLAGAVATILAAALAIVMVRALARRQEDCQKAAEAWRATHPPAPPAAPSTGFVWNAPGI